MWQIVYDSWRTRKASRSLVECKRNNYRSISIYFVFVSFLPLILAAREKERERDIHATRKLMANDNSANAFYPLRSRLSEWVLTTINGIIIINPKVNAAKQFNRNEGNKGKNTSWITWHKRVCFTKKKIIISFDIAVNKFFAMGFFYVGLCSRRNAMEMFGCFRFYF